MAYRYYIQGIYDFINILVIALFGISFIFAFVVILKPTIGNSRSKGKFAVIYTLIISLLFFAVPILTKTIHSSSLLFGIYASGLIFGPFISSLALAINLKGTGLKLQRKQSKRIFVTLVCVAILLLIYFLAMVGAVISSLV